MDSEQRAGDDLTLAVFERLGLDAFVLEVDPAAEVLRIVDASQSALRTHGYTRDELVGHPLATIDPDVSADRFRDLETGLPAVWQTRRRRKDGSSFDVEVRVVQTGERGRKLFLSVEQDIGDRKRAEARFAHLRQLMDYVIAHARSAIAVHDRELRYIYVSERYLREYNVTAQDVIGRHHYDVFPDLPQRWRAVHQRALCGEISSAEEDPFQRADGSVEWTRWECRPWYESDGSIGGIVIYTEVITERKRAEQERKVLEDQLQQAMKMEAVGRLAGGVAHDFNNLLTVIMGTVDLAVSDLEPNHPLCARLRDIGEAAESAASLTRQLLSFSRKQIIEPQAIDVNGLVTRMQKLLRRLIGEDVALRLELGIGLASIRVDPGQFEQVLVNLAVNARDAMPGGGRLTIETASVQLDETYCAAHALARPGAYVMMAVSDSGQGMSEEVKRHLFEPFFTTKARGRGTGLGLATIFGIVKQAGGSIRAYSELGHGSCFKIYLPAVEEQPVLLERADAEWPRGGETVLLVEDEEALRRLAGEVLSRLGYRIIEAANGAQALAALERHTGPLDLLLTDVIMPGMNGWALSQAVLQIHPGAKVLFTSGYTENLITREGALDSGIEFIAKPYAPRGLAEKVREVLAR